MAARTVVCPPQNDAKLRQTHHRCQRLWQLNGNRCKTGAGSFQCGDTVQQPSESARTRCGDVARVAFANSARSQEPFLTGTPREGCVLGRQHQATPRLVPASPWSDGEAGECEVATSARSPPNVLQIAMNGNYRRGIRKVASIREPLAAQGIPDAFPASRCRERVSLDVLVAELRLVFGRFAKRIWKPSVPLHSRNYPAGQVLWATPPSDGGAGVVLQRAHSASSWSIAAIC